MSCRHCGFDNPPGVRFCGQCGAKLGVRCTQCGAESLMGFQFCGECGSPLAGLQADCGPAGPAASPARPAATTQGYTPPHLVADVLQTKAAFEGERKQVTVLFCDLVGSTTLAERLGPEPMHLVLNRFFELAVGEVHRYEGTINQFLGDGFMALFGAPIAHEDHARRASLAALGLVKLLEEEHGSARGPGPAERAGGKLEVRMGLNTGWVVVGGIGDRLRQDYTAIGDTTNLAARLQQAADPDTILVSEETSRLLQGSARLAPLALLAVKGKQVPVQAYQLLGLGLLQPEQAVLGSAALSPFAGRRRELTAIEELRERAALGEGQVVGIAAEAGAGKSRLLYEFRNSLPNRPACFLAGRCLSYAGGIPFLPILHLLRNHCGIDEADVPATLVAKVSAGLGLAGMDVEDARPYVLRLLGVDVDGEKLAELSPQALQTRTFRVLRQMFLQAGHGGLVVMEVEDLQWLDRSSEDFLCFLVDGLVAAQMLLIVTYRSGYRPPWIEKSYASQITLPRLTEVESWSVVRSVLRRAEPTGDLVGTVLARAEGNPFFLEELARSMLERPSATVPDTIQGVLMARIDRLPEDHKRLLQTASVLGREFPLNLLAAVWEQPEELPSLLAELKRWEFLYEEPMAAESRYLFRHALTQEAIYETLLVSRRQALHAAAGRAFESLYAGRLVEVYDALAYHYSEAGDPEQAVAHLVLFAEQAAGRYAHAEAAAALRQALEHAEDLPRPEGDRRVADLVLRLASSLLPLACFRETREQLLRYAERIARVADPVVTARSHFWLAHTHSYLGDLEQAAASARLAIAAARLGGDAATEGRAWYVLSRDAFWSGRFRAGIEDGNQAVKLLEESGDRWWQGQAYWVAGFHHYLLGQFEEAFDRMRQAEAIWRALEDPRLDPSWSTGYFHTSLGAPELGIEACKGGLERALDPLNTGAALGFLGYAYLEKGDLAAAVESLEGAIDRMRRAGMQQLLGWFSAFLAQAHLLAGRLAEAGELARQALDATQGTRFRYGVGLAERVMGRIAGAAGEPAAEGWLREALASFEAIEAPFEAARTRVELALLAASRGDRDMALGLVDEARARFAELRLQGFVEQADGVARELAASHA